MSHRSAKAGGQSEPREAWQARLCQEVGVFLGCTGHVGKRDVIILLVCAASFRVKVEAS